MLVLTDIYKSFEHRGKRIAILNGLNLRLEAGESLAVMGASGVGKSTLLHIMGSLDPPTSGKVTFNGVDLYGMDEATLCRFRNREIGFVFQFHHLLPELNALENVMMPALIARVPKERSVRLGVAALEKVGLTGRLDHRAGELSGGEQQRVAIARALLMEPKLILADEPTGNLDVQTGEEVSDLLVRLNQDENMAMVIVTHNQRLAEKMSRRMEIVNGKIC